jgi:hypothetical protein
MKIAAYILSAMAVLISDIGFATVAYQYRDMLCGIEHAGYSAPTSITFLYAIPFAAATVACIGLAILFFKKAKQRDT